MGEGDILLELVSVNQTRHHPFLSLCLSLSLAHICKLFSYATKQITSALTNNSPKVVGGAVADVELDRLG